MLRKMCVVLHMFSWARASHRLHTPCRKTPVSAKHTPCRKTRLAAKRLCLPSTRLAAKRLCLPSTRLAAKRLCLPSTCLAAKRLCLPSTCLAAQHALPQNAYVCQAHTLPQNAHVCQAHASPVIFPGSVVYCVAYTRLDTYPTMVACYPGSILYADRVCAIASNRLHKNLPSTPRRLGHV